MSDLSFIMEIDYIVDGISHKAGFAYAAKYEIEAGSSGLTEDDNGNVQTV